MSSMQVDSETENAAVNLAAPVVADADAVPGDDSQDNNSVDFDLGRANDDTGTTYNAEIQHICARIPYHRIPKGVTCYSCGTWNRVQPRLLKKYYSIVRGEFVGIFFNEWDTIKAWVLRYSDNGVRSFGADEYDDALEFFNSELAINRVIDKHGVVAAWVDNKPAGYVPNSRGLVLAATPSIPAPAPLANPY